MATLWARFFGRNEDRDSTMTLEQWADLQFKYNGTHYFRSGGGGDSGSGNSENIESDFCGYVNGAYKTNGIVFAVCQARLALFSEMRFQYQKMNDGRPGDFEDDPAALAVLNTPWPNGTTGELLARAIQDVDMCGNHYVVRKDGPDGTRLRRLRPDWVSIALSADPTEALASDITGYVYKPGNTDNPDLWEIFPIDGSNGAVAHWSPIPDPEAQYRGMSWLTPVIKEIIADKAITRHKQKFFDNGATPGLVVSLNESVSPEQFEEFMQKMDNSHRGVDAAYKTLYLGGGADVTVAGSNIQQLDFREITGMGEVRIAAAARVHPVILGINDGLQGSSLNEGNFQSAKDLLGDATMRPLWRSLCASYAVLVESKPGTRLWYDDRDIAFLLEDRKKVAEWQMTQATAITRYVMQGFKPETAVKAVKENNVDYLEHTGLYSVQLLPPNISHPEKYPDQDSKTLPKATAKNNQKGRPKATTETKDALLDAGVDPELVDEVMRQLEEAP